MKKWFTNCISGLRKGTDVLYPENIPHLKNIGGKSLRLQPINKWPKNQTFFDCILYFIFCSKHQKIAVCDNAVIHRDLAVWLPFIYLSPETEHRLTELEGLSLILSDGDSQLMAKYREERPFDTNIAYLHRIDLKQFKIDFTTFWCLARLHSDNSVLQCCQKTSRIVWMSVQDFLNEDTYCLWSNLLKVNEIFDYVNDIRITSLVSNDPFSWADNYNLEAEPQNQGQMILKTLKITKKQIHLFLYDFLKHCFPTPVMSYVSFTDYLKKYFEYSVEDKWLRRLFNSCSHYFEDFGSFVRFEIFLLCLACLDIECPSCEDRLGFVFRYYDFDRDGYLSEEEVREMVRDIDTNQSQEVIERVVSDNIFMNESEKGISLQEFKFRAEEHWLEGTDRLCRFNSPNLRKLLSDLENREKSGFKKRLNHYFRSLLND